MLNPRENRIAAGRGLETREAIIGVVFERKAADNDIIEEIVSMFL